MATQYRIYFTPPANGSIYGTEIEVSGFILDAGMGVMKKSIDSGDYDIGVYTYGDVTIKVINENGYLNDSDSRSIFLYGRDKTKVRITYDDGTTETDIFKGLINEEGSKQDLDDDMVEFKVISRDSVIRTTQVAGGLLTSGSLASTAIKSILNQASITKVLNYNAANINVGSDFTIDVATELENQSAREALNNLLFATNSVFLIDSSDNMIVKPRNDYGPNLLALKGPFAQHSDQNILQVTLYNTGKHRVFNSVMVNNQQYVQTAYVEDYGFRQKDITFPFITNATTEATLARTLSSEFKLPKVECNVYVPTHVARGYNLMDLASVDWPLRTKPFDNSFFPIVGGTKIGDAEMPLPYEFGSLSIRPNMAFKIIEISEDPKNFNTHLKLRQTGSEYNDGYFSQLASSIVGFAIIDESTVSGAGDACDAYNPSVIAAARVGCTLVA